MKKYWVRIKPGRKWEAVYADSMADAAIIVARRRSKNDNPFTVWEAVPYTPRKRRR